VAVGVADGAFVGLAVFVAVGVALGQADGRGVVVGAIVGEAGTSLVGEGVWLGDGDGGDEATVPARPGMCW
jgi:hypothetical protein